MDCRNKRAIVRAERIKANGGSHTKEEWEALLARSPTCAVCGRNWPEVPPRPDSRYKNTWTKGHKIPIFHGGSDAISNIQAECYECNFKKNAGKLKTSKDHVVARDQDRFSRAFCFVLKSGKEIYPVKMKCRETGKIAFRISPGGTGGNTKKASEEVDETTMMHKVLLDGYAVRCSSLDGEVNGLYKAGHRSVREVRRSA
ncbi:HNH endonuclease signature motif containing protein [Sulfurimicrobium lacus]|uniref:HNH endonuclease signature motif containing protein n=1 Tax=Sulfurimicrobium lacus TaxID=2715678 RepID=UPI001566D0EA|nr:HNH endonuclease signature motif containing protein [Sulfurimicrobium lacus]